MSRCALFGRLFEAERVVQISAPAGSGKTVLMRSWIAEAGLAQHAAWVPVDSQERDPRRFWISVADALRGTAAGSALVRPLTAAPGLDGWAVVERLLKDLAPLEDRLWLVIDDAHLLDAGEVLPQLELLVLRAPQELRFVLATRHDLRLGLHRLRLEGELTEIRAADQRFSLAEARALFGATGVELPAEALARLHGRTEGWAAGLRLAALSLAGHPEPERFVAEFSGTDRTVAEYLAAEVLDRQSEEARRLLLRTSLLERVSGPLADVLTGSSGGERILQDLEQAGAFVVSLDAGRSWFRYHRLFADLLQLELRRTEPNERAALHRAAAAWLAGHGHPVEAVRQAQAAEMGSRRPAAIGPLARPLPQRTGRHFGRAAGQVPPPGRRGQPGAYRCASGRRLDRGIPAGRRTAPGRGHWRAGVGACGPAWTRTGHARGATALPGPAPERPPGGGRGGAAAARLMTTADAAQLGLGEDLRAAALISLGIAEIWTLRFEDAERHLEQGVDLARQIGRPYWSSTAWPTGRTRCCCSGPVRRSGAEQAGDRAGGTARLGRGAARRVAYAQLGIVMLYQGRLEEQSRGWSAPSGPWRRGGSRAGMSLRYARAVLELARGRYQEALAAFRGAEKLAVTLVGPHTSVTSMRSRMLQTLVRLGQTGRAEQVLAELGGTSGPRGDAHRVAALRLASDDPQAAADALAPVLDGSIPVSAACGW